MKLEQNWKSHQKLVLLSPLLVIGIAHLTTRFAGVYLGVWAWIPLALVYWATMIFFIMRNGGRQAIVKWLQPSQGRWGWPVLALAVGFIPFPLILYHWQLLIPTEIWTMWLAFALINPWLEEGYWRGVLMDATDHWPTWVRLFSTSIVFAASHPLMWGVHSDLNLAPEVFISTFIMGLAWSAVYYVTKSLRWTIVSHILVDLFNLSVPVFLNLYIPPL